MKPKGQRRLSDFVMAGAADWAIQDRGNRLPGDATEAERQAYHDGWMAAAKDDLAARLQAVRAVQR